MFTMLYSSHSFVATIKMTVANNDDNHSPVRRSWPRRDDLTKGERRSRVRPKIEIALSLTSCHGTAYIYPTLRGSHVLHALRRQYSSSAYNMSQRLCCIFNLTCKTQMESLHFIFKEAFMIEQSSEDRWIETSTNQEIDGSPLDWWIK